METHTFQARLAGLPFSKPTAGPAEIHTKEKKKTQTRPPAAISFEMYYSSCESFSWNYKLCITSERRGPKFPNPASQTSLKRSIYLPAFSQVSLVYYYFISFSSHTPHVEHTLRVMVLLKGRWFPSKKKKKTGSCLR